jgi:hypothetical protein
VVAGHALRPHRAELLLHPGPELLQTHDPTVPSAAGRPARTAYPRGMPLSTGSATWDTVLQLGIAAAMVANLVLIVRGYRNRG